MVGSGNDMAVWDCAPNSDGSAAEAFDGAFRTEGFSALDEAEGFPRHAFIGRMRIPLPGDQP